MTSYSLCYLIICWVKCIHINNLFNAIANRGGAKQNDIHLHQCFFPLRAKHHAKRQMTHSCQVGSSCAGRNLPRLSFPLHRPEHKMQLLLLKDLEQLFSTDTVKKMISEA